MDRIFDPFFTTKKPGEGTVWELSVHMARKKLWWRDHSASEVGEGRIQCVPSLLIEVRITGSEGQTPIRRKEANPCWDDETVLVDLERAY